MFILWDQKNVIFYLYYNLKKKINNFVLNTKCKSEATLPQKEGCLSPFPEDNLLT